MSDLVDAVRAERRALIEPLLAPVADKLAALDEMERLALSLNGGGSDVSPVAELPAPAAAPPPPKPKPREAQRALPARPKATTQGRDGLGAKAQATLEALRSHPGWVKPAVLAAHEGQERGKIGQRLMVLVERGLAEARGKTVSREYRAIVSEKPAAARSTFGQGRSPASRQAASVQGRVIEAVGYRPSNVDDLAGRLNAAIGEVVTACDQLVRDGDIALRGDGRYHAA